MLLVAAIPVAMPTVLSVAMAVGARLLAKKEAIVTRLSAIEKLAGVDVLCSVKISSKDFRVRKLVQKLGLVRGNSVHGKGIAQGQLVLSQCAGLVRTEHVHAS